MKKHLFLGIIIALTVILISCENQVKDTTPPIISEAEFLPADCDIYYVGETLLVHFVCSDDSELGNYNIEIHSNFDHHTHGTSGVDCDEETDEEQHHEDEEHNHEDVEGAWVYNQDFTISSGQTSAVIDLAIPIPDDAVEGDYHFMLRLTDRAGWQSIKAVAIHLKMNKRMKVILLITGIVVLLFALVCAVLSHPAFGRRMSAESKERILSSPNYRDGAFRNEQPTPQFTGEKGSTGTLWKFLFGDNSNRVPSEPLHTIKTDLRSLNRNSDWLVWFGHSSYLFCLAGKTFLVDPVLDLEFPASLALRPYKGTDIYHADDMPEIDYLIITHEHWDHLDYGTLRRLKEKVKYAVCPLGIGEYLEYWGYPKGQITEMDWYESHEQITCLPSRHFSNRLLGDRDQTLWASFMVEADGRKVYIGGDGGYDDRFERIHNQFGEVDLAFLENGQYNDNWKYIHTTPEDLAKVIHDLQAKQVFTVHHDKFTLSVHPWYEPDSVAHSIADKQHIRLLDAPIGSVVRF